MARKKPRPIEIGDTFGRLTVLREWGRNKRSHRKWMCRCSCGGFAVVRAADLNSGNNLSCGCLKRERSAERCRTHGMRGTPTYKSWDSMLQRCKNPKDSDYSNYGGRGVKVCDRWDPAKGGSFQNFYADMGARSEGTSVDKDIEGDGLLYSPETCVWATRVEQNNAKRSNRIIEYDDKSQSLAQWARDQGMSKNTLCNRLNRGWSVEKALTASVRPRKKAPATECQQQEARAQSSSGS